MSELQELTTLLKEIEDDLNVYVDNPRLGKEVYVELYGSGCGVIFVEKSYPQRGRAIILKARWDDVDSIIPTIKTIRDQMKSMLEGCS